MFSVKSQFFFGRGCELKYLYMDVFCVNLSRLNYEGPQSLIRAPNKAYLGSISNFNQEYLQDLRANFG